MDGRDQSLLCSIKILVPAPASQVLTVVEPGDLVQILYKLFKQEISFIF